MSQQHKPQQELHSTSNTTTLHVQLERMLNQLNDHYVSYDREWRYVFVNTKATEILGLPKEQLLGACIWELFPDAIGNEYYRAVHRALAEQQDSTFEFYYPPFNRWFENRIYAAPDGVSVLGTDITERKRTEDQLRRSHDTFLNLIQNAPFGVYLVDAQFRLAQVSVGSQKIFQNIAPLIGRNFAEILRIVWAEPFASEAIERFRHILATGESHASQATEQRGNIATIESYDWQIERITMPDGQYGVVCYFYDMTERQHAEAALRESEEKLLAALEGGQLGTWAWDPVTNRSLPDRHVLQLFGIDPAGFNSDATTIFERIHTEDLEAVYSALHVARQPGQEYRAEFRVVLPSREIRWLAGIGRGRFDNNGQLQQVYGVNFDITERKHREQDGYLLTELSDLIRLAQDSDTLLAAIVKMVGQYLQVTRCFITEIDQTLNRWSVKQDYHADSVSLAGSYHISDYPLDLVEAMRNGHVISSADAQSDPVSTPFYQAAFAPIGARAYLVIPFLRNGDWVSNLVVLHNIPRYWHSREITLLKAVAERTWNAIEKLRLQSVEHDYNWRLQQLTTASLTINAQSNRTALLRHIIHEARSLMRANMAVVSLFQDGNWLNAETIISLAEPYAAWETYSAQPTGEGIYRMVIEEHRSLRLTQQELLRHPAWRNFSTHTAQHPPLNGLLAVPLLIDDGICVGIIQLSDKVQGVFTAIDEALLQQLAQIASVALKNQMLYDNEQQARTQAEQANRQKDEFLATVSHELRTPLTALLGYAQLLQLRKRDEAYVARTIEKIIRNARIQVQLTEDLLDVARIVSGKIRMESHPVSFITVIQAALDTVRPTVEAKGLALQVQLNQAASHIIGDANRLQQVVWNLLSNAAKFTPVGGKISIQLELERQHACLTISDTGQGIPAAFLPYVFDRFRQADSTSNRVHGGLGLGLSIVRHLVELHGGSVYVKSEGVDQGSAFTVCLPLAHGGIDIPEKALVLNTTMQGVPYTTPPELIGLRIVVVDDHIDIIELLQEVLLQCGAIVQCCTTAAEALQAVQEWKPDLLISDIAMPGADGYWLIHQVRSLPSEQGGMVAALALTAYVRLEDRVQVLAEGFQLYISKPVEPADLINAVAFLARGLATMAEDIV